MDGMEAAMVAEAAPAKIILVALSTACLFACTARDASSLQSSGRDEGYRYQNQLCQKSNAKGNSLNFFGECGDVREQRIENKTMKDFQANGLLFVRSTLDKGSFEDSSFAGANFAEGRIAHSNFSKTSFKNATFRATTFVRISFKNSNLSGANLSGSRFYECEILSSDLRQTDWRSARFHKLKILDSDLRGANLKEAAFIFADFRGSRFDSTTELPFSRASAERMGMVYQP